MLDKILTSIKKCVWFLFLSCVLIILGYFFHWFYIFGIGIIFTVFTFVYFVNDVWHGDKDELKGTGVGCFVTVIFTIAALIYSDTRYITPHGHKQHIYSDCHTIMHSNNVKEVSELEGFFHLVFSDCKSCEKRKEREIQERRESRECVERREMREYLQELIDMLDNGASAGDIKSILQNDWTVHEEYDYTPGIPSRYQ